MATIITLLFLNSLYAVRQLQFNINLLKIYVCVDLISLTMVNSSKVIATDIVIL